MSAAGLSIAVFVIGPMALLLGVLLYTYFRDYLKKKGRYSKSIAKWEIAVGGIIFIGILCFIFALHWGICVFLSAGWTGWVFYRVGQRI